MSDLIEKTMIDMSNWSKKLANKATYYIQTAIGKGGELTKKGKIQFEIKLSKREYNKKVQEFGEYILKKSEEGVTDFSIDPEFIKYNEMLLSFKKIIKKLNTDMKLVGNEKSFIDK